MQEACYCGRVGEVEDREPAYGGDGARVKALRCSWCGHLDSLPQLDNDARREVFEEAERRSLERLAGGERTRHGIDRAVW